MKTLLQNIIIVAVIILSINNSFSDTLTFSKSYGNFQNAVSVSPGRGEFVFICDAAANLVYKYSNEGKELAKFGGMGFGQNEFNYPVSIDAGDGLNLYICDNQNNRIQKLDYKLNFIAGYDFNQYNTTADNSKKILYPNGIAVLSSGDLAVTVTGSDFKAAVITTFSDISIYMGSSFSFDRIGNAKKIVRGKELDLWILDTETNEIVNFSTSGQFLKRLKTLDNSIIQNITFYNDNLYLLTNGTILKYDLKANKFDRKFSYGLDEFKKINDFAFLNNSTVLLLSDKKIYQYNLLN